MTRGLVGARSYGTAKAGTTTAAGGRDDFSVQISLPVELGSDADHGTIGRSIIGQQRKKGLEWSAESCRQPSGMR